MLEYIKSLFWKSTTLEQQQQNFQQQGLDVRLQVPQERREVVQEQPPQPQWIDQFDNLNEQQKQYISGLVTGHAKSKFITDYLKEIEDKALMLKIAEKNLSFEVLTGLYNGIPKDQKEELFPTLLDLSEEDIETFRGQQALQPKLSVQSIQDLRTLLAKIRTEVHLVGLFKKLDANQLISFKDLDNNQVQTFLAQDSEGFAAIKNLGAEAAKSFLTALRAKPSLQALFTDYREKSLSLGGLEEVELKVVQDLSSSELKIEVMSWEAREIQRFGQKVNGNARFLTLVQGTKTHPAKIKTKSNAVKLLGLTEEQVTTYLGITNDKQLRQMEGMSTSKIVSLLDAMQGGLSAPALNAFLGQNPGDLSTLSDEQLTFVLGHRSNEHLQELGGLDSKNLEILRSLSKEELKGYFEATAGKPALKTEVRKLPKAQLQLFCTEFANPDQDTKDTLTYLNAHPTYLEYWALLPNAQPAERKNKKLYLAVDSVKTSQVSKHIEGEVPGHGRAVGGHFAGDLKYHADGTHQGYVKNTSDKLRFKPAWVTSPANYHTTAPFPYNPGPTDPMTIDAPAVRDTNEIEMNNSGVWVAKTNIHGLKIGSSIFPNNWTLTQVEAETALACFKINANPGTAHVNANTYRVMDSAGTTRLQLFIGDSTDPHPFVSKPNVDLDIKSCFPS